MIQAAKPIIISVAPNGARKTKSDHPNLPISPEEIANEAAECMKAGASLLHLHVRNDNDEHSLEIERYKAAIAAIRQKVGDKLIIQVTTEACGVYTPDVQINVVRELKPEAASLAVREIIPDKHHENTAKEFLHWVERENICPQFILYSDKDTERFFDLKKRGVIPQSFNMVLFVLGRYSADQQSAPNDLLPFLHTLENQDDYAQNTEWSVCAFGKLEAGCMLGAALMNGHVRIGFENNMLLNDGSTAPDNAALIKQFTEASKFSGRQIATPDEARSILFAR